MDQSKIVSVNINAECEVVLRARGVVAILKHYARLSLDPPEIAVGETFTAPLWEVMTLMGSECFMGPEPPFDTEIIIAERP